MNWFKNIGPGTLVAAAFIGPGTVTVCTLAGVQFGFTLMWAMVLSIVATIVLQEMAARTGIITQKGLAEVIKEQAPAKWIKNVLIAIILIAIVAGNAAYEAGNIGGASLGLEAILGTSKIYPVVIGVLAFLLLFIGSYKVLEKILVVLVIIMSLSFLITAILTKPNILALLKGVFVPSVPKNSILTIVGLLGTTVVPYNLFLHASLVKERWKHAEDIKNAKIDTTFSIILGGLVSMAIIICAASLQNTSITNVTDLAKGLAPLYGSFAKYFLGIGLFAAGITSAVTAPLAAAYVANSCFGWQASLKDWRFRLVWAFILCLGVGSLSFNIKPIELIQLAQVANGILLPVIAVFLLWVVNKTLVLGKYRNTAIQNVLAGGIIILTIILGVRSLLKVFNIW